MHHIHNSMRKWLENLKRKLLAKEIKFWQYQWFSQYTFSKWETERFLEFSDIDSSWNSTFPVESKVRIIFNEVQIITFKFGYVCVSSCHVNGSLFLLAWSSQVWATSRPEVKARVVRREAIKCKMNFMVNSMFSILQIS